MKANKDFYLMYRAAFLKMGYVTEVKQLDNNFELTLIYDKHGVLKFIL